MLGARSLCQSLSHLLTSYLHENIFWCLRTAFLTSKLVLILVFRVVNCFLFSSLRLQVTFGKILLSPGMFLTSKNLGYQFILIFVFRIVVFTRLNLLYTASRVRVLIIGQKIVLFFSTLTESWQLESACVVCTPKYAAYLRFQQLTNAQLMMEKYSVSALIIFQNLISLSYGRYNI